MPHPKDRKHRHIIGRKHGGEKYRPRFFPVKWHSPTPCSCVLCGVKRDLLGPPIRDRRADAAWHDEAGEALQHLIYEDGEV